MLRTLILGITSCSIVATYSLVATAQQGPPVNEFAQSMAEFHERIDAYLKLRDKVTREIPKVKETGDPAKISARENALGEAIARARSTAKPGDVFGAAMSIHLKRILAKDWKSRSPADRKALFNELPAGVRIGINRPYPTTLPLVSVPAVLLAELPTLPETLEYRLVDHYLLLRDRDANLVIDVLPDVRPQRGT